MLFCHHIHPTPVYKLCMKWWFVKNLSNAWKFYNSQNQGRKRAMYLVTKVSMSHLKLKKYTPLKICLSNVDLWILPNSNSNFNSTWVEFRSYFCYLNLGEMWKIQTPPEVKVSLHLKCRLFWFWRWSPPPFWNFSTIWDIFSFDWSPKYHLSW